MVAEIQNTSKKKMDHTLDLLKNDLAAVRTGRASAEILNPIMVDYYGTSTPLNQLATLNTPDAQLITVTPFDKSTIKDVEKAIMASDLGLNPSSDGSMIRVPIPVLTEERRKELAKHVKKMGEDSKIAMRNIRRDANDMLKAKEKNKEISQDEEKVGHQKIQEVTDTHVKSIEELVKSKEKELMTV
ncbi:MAG: ribosome recycling factor [SAR324 cluster bacterium]|nr:ribosome recycling factor [SAR324 cluster bacterium]